jgi:hypothetical protein
MDNSDRARPGSDSTGTPETYLELLMTFWEGIKTALTICLIDEIAKELSEEQAHEFKEQMLSADDLCFEEPLRFALIASILNALGKSEPTEGDSTPSPAFANALTRGFVSFEQVVAAEAETALEDQTMRAIWQAFQRQLRASIDHAFTLKLPALEQRRKLRELLGLNGDLPSLEAALRFLHEQTPEFADGVTQALLGFKQDIDRALQSLDCAPAG